jgi:hypothetical protein
MKWLLVINQLKETHKIGQLAPIASQLTKNEPTDKLDKTDSNQAAHLNC